MHCPRCKAEVAEGSAACPRCAAPLSLREEPAPPPLDADLSLDRRRGRRPAPGAADETDPAPWRRAREASGEPLPPDTTEPSPWQGRRSGGRAVPAGDGPVPRVTPRFWWMEPGALPPEAPPGEGAGFEILGPVAEPAAAGRTPAARPRQVPLPLPPAGPFDPAPPGRRLLSWAVDGTLAGALAWLLLAAGSLLAGPDAAVPAPAALLPPAAGLAAAIHFVHAALGVGLAGQTLGKWMAALAVRGPEGRAPGPGRAAARALLSLLSAGLLGIGLVPALVGRRARALHDIALSTEVVRVP